MPENDEKQVPAADAAGAEKSAAAENTKTLQQLIREKFDTGEGDQVLNLTVRGVSDENIEILIAGRRYSVVGDTIFLLNGRAANLEKIGAETGDAKLDGAQSAQPGSLEQEGSEGGEGSGDDKGASAEPAGQAGSAVSGELGGQAGEAGNVEGSASGASVNAEPSGDSGIGAGQETGGETTEGGASVKAADDPAIDPTLKQVMEKFGADDLRQVGEAVKDGADIFELLKGGEVVETGTLAELEAKAAG
jgi:hypothetical protein